MLTLLLSACAIQEYQPLPLDTRQVFSTYSDRDLDIPGLRDFMRRHGYAPAEWPMTEWDADALTLAALYFNQDLKVAVAEWQARRAGEITAAQRPNPMFNLPLEWHTDTSDGQSPWLIGAVLDLILERPGKRQARIEQAELSAAAAQLEIDQVAWRIRSHVHTAIAELMAAKDAYAALQQRLDIINDIFDLLQQREELGQIAAYELSASSLELQRLQLELSRQENRIAVARGQLAAAIGVPPDALENVSIAGRGLDSLPDAEQVPSTDMRGLALKNRYDIRQALASYAAQEAALRLEIEKQYPDINLSPGFVFDQSDNVWQLGAAWILPLFHNHEGQIAEAMAQRAVLQERFLQLQADIIDRVHEARTEFIGKVGTLKEAQTLASEAGDYRDRIDQQLSAGYADRLQYLRARQAYSEATQALAESRADVLRSYAQLEAMLQHPVTGPDWTQTVTSELVADTRSPEGGAEQ